MVRVTVVVFLCVCVCQMSVCYHSSGDIACFYIHQIKGTDLVQLIFKKLPFKSRAAKHAYLRVILRKYNKLYGPTDFCQFLRMHARRFRVFSPRGGRVRVYTCMYWLRAFIVYVGQWSVFNNTGSNTMAAGSSSSVSATDTDLCFCY